LRLLPAARLRSAERFLQQRNNVMWFAISWLLGQPMLAALSGLSVGFTLGLVGGGAGMLAVPLLLYFVKVGDPHVAVGTTAAALALTAGVNLVRYARAGLVRWRTGSTFALGGIAAAFAGSLWSLHTDGGALLFLLAAIVATVSVLMLSRAGAASECPAPAQAAVRTGTGRVFATAGAGAAVGSVAGFFGVSGGFLSVPALHFIARLTLIEAVASSLVSVVAFDATTAVNYARAGKVSVALALALVTGGIAGGAAGMRVARSLAIKGHTLQRLFALVLMAIAIYITYRGLAR
jgi:uncharacterized membrane protein YfcA